MEELTRGEQLIGKLNLIESESVSRIKAAAIALIDVIDNQCPEGRRKSKALTEIETSAMFAVKAVFQG